MQRLLLAIWLCFAAVSSPAQEFSGLARVVPGESVIENGAGGIQLTLTLSQGVPYRVFTLDAPRRLVLDFREVEWQGVTPEMLDDSTRVSGVRMGGFRPGWSRMVVDLAGAYALRSADLRIARGTGHAKLRVNLTEVAPEEFAAASGAPETPGWGTVVPRERSGRQARQRGDGPLVVMLDPGHGGIDPGATNDGTAEKDLMLTFARELREVLIRSGDFDVHLTRTDDRFVSLERRVSLAHEVGADVFLSLHADALSEGRARGATVYVLSESASDEASAALAERHDRDDMLAGIDLSGQDDVVADVLMDLARMETQPRARRLAEALVLALREGGLPLHSRPHRGAGFSVLKSPDIPSILLELGFLSSQRDLENLRRPAWRATMAESVRDALAAWRVADAAAADLVRQ